MLAPNASQLSLLMLLVAIGAAKVQCAYNATAYCATVYNDTSNDDAIRFSPQQLIVASGFKYEQYYVVSSDGYIQSIIHLINPKANQTALRKTPIIIYHGANIDASCYMISSSKQHHPEKYPRTSADGPITSSNRSLAFFLVNNGVDVYLIGSRGSNKDNQRWTNSSVIKDQIARDDYSSLNNDSLYDYAKTSSYWQYNLDNVIKYDIKLHIDKVRNISGASKFHIFSYSLSTPTTLAFLTANPDYARNVSVYTEMAPAIAASHNSSFDELYFEKLCPLFPSRGEGFFPTFTIQPLLREFLIGVSVSPEVTYSLIYLLTTQIFGFSPICNTYLERNVISHILQPVSFDSVQQYCQNSVAVPRRLNMFDYGAQMNPSHYNGSITPPPYNVSYLPVDQYVILNGETDGLANVETVNRLIATVGTDKPVIKITGPSYNHLDMIAATKNDIDLYFPFLDIIKAYP